MNKVFLQQMRENLLSQKKYLLIKSNRNLDVDTDGDEMDIIQANLLMEISNQLDSRDFEKINLIDNALKRLDENIYGICEDCNDGIPEKRLLHNPYFLTCVFCAEDRESEEKQRKKY